MARLVVVLVDGMPERAFYDEAQAQEHVAGRRAQFRTGGFGDEMPGFELWDVPIGRSVGVAEQVVDGDE